MYSPYYRTSHRLPATLPPVADCIDLSPSEYISLTPTQRLMYIVKKTEYHPCPELTTNHNFQKDDPDFENSPHLSPSHSSTQLQPMWTAKISNTSILRSDRLPSQRKRKALDQRSIVGRKRVTWKDIEQDRPCQGRKRPRPQPASASANRTVCRPAKRFRFSEKNLVKEAPASCPQVIGHLLQPIAYKQGHVLVLFQRKETAKQEMRAERWNLRLAYGTVSPMKMRHDPTAIINICRTRGVLES